MEAVAALDYSPSQLGRNLRRRETNIIGLIVSDIQNPFFTSIIRAIQDVTHEKNYVLFIANSDEKPEEELIHIQKFRAYPVAGLILVPSRSDYSDLQEFFRDMSVVAIDRKPNNLEVDTVTVDNAEGIQNATSYLIELGHHRIGCLIGLPRLSTSQERLAGYLAAHQQAGREVDPSLIQVGYFTQPGGYSAMERLLGLSNPPTAVVSANNLMTLGAIQAIHHRCIKIPDDIAVVGFDDMDWATSLQPALTVVAQPTYEIGRRTALLLLERLANPDLPVQHVVLETELIVRASTLKVNC